MDHRLVVLDDAVNRHQARSHHHLALGGKGVGPDHEVGDSGLVLERDEAHPLGASRSLANEDQPGKADPPPIAHRAKRVGGDETTFCIMVAKELHRMRLQAQPDGLVVADHMLGERHRGELGRLGFGALVAGLRGCKQRQFGNGLEGLRLPQRGTSVEPDRPERIGFRQPLDRMRR